MQNESRPTNQRGGIGAAAALALLLGCMTPIVSADAPTSRGEALYLNHCTACHESGVHIRAKRKAESRDDIRQWIVRWVKEQNLDWTNEEVKDGKYVDTGDPVEKRLMKQWMLKITAYADRLLNDLDDVDVIASQLVR